MPNEILPKLVFYFT